MKRGVPRRNSAPPRGVALGIQSHEQFAWPAVQAAAASGTAGRRWWHAQGQPGGAVGVCVIVTIDLGGLAVLGRCDAGESRLDLGLAQVHQARTGTSAGGDRGQALLDVAAMGFDVDRRECLEGRAVRRPLKSPRASRWSARLFDLSCVEGLAGCDERPWSIRPF